MNATSLGFALGSLSRYVTSPYTPDPLNIEAYEGVQPESAFGFFTTPLRASAKYNLAKMAFWGSRSLGLTSSLQRPFDRRRLGWSYKSMHVSGLTGDVARDISPDKLIRRAADAVVPEEVWEKSWRRTMERPTRLPQFSYQPTIKRPFTHVIDTPFMPKGWRPDMDIPSTEGLQYRRSEYMKARSAYETADDLLKPTFLQQWLIRPHEFERTLRSIDPSLVTGNKLDRAVDSYLRGMYRLDKEYSGLANIPKRMREYFADVGLGLSRAPGTEGYSRPLVNRFVTQQRDRFTSLWDLVSGRGKRGKYYERVGQHLDDVVSGRKHFSVNLFGASRSRRRARMVMRAQDELTDVVAKSLGREHAVSESVQKTLQDYTMLMDRRLRMARLLKTGFWATIGVEAVTGIASTLYREVTSGIGRAATSLGQINMMEFGGGDVIRNSALATERQRAVEAISNAQMNARYLLGSEAQMYH